MFPTATLWITSKSNAESTFFTQININHVELNQNPETEIFEKHLMI